jgi:UPF0271 protein
MPTIDLNCDMGEIPGGGEEEAILPHITSTSIACGVHAGDADTMRRTIVRALQHNVAIGAHPGLPDRAGFGRRSIVIDPADADDLVMTQIAALDTIARSEGATLRHVKAHGALYTMAAVDPDLARAIAAAVAGYDRTLILFGPPGSALVDAGRELGLRVARECFADRRYRSDGSLVPRGDPRALIDDEVEAAAQARSIALTGLLRSDDGAVIALEADTICIHGDAPGSAARAAGIARTLRESGILLAPSKGGG